jgi:hypothetical protein
VDSRQLAEVQQSFASRQIIDELWLFFSEEYECGIHMKTDVSESIELILDVSVIGRDFHNIYRIYCSRKQRSHNDSYRILTLIYFSDVFKL